MPPRTMRALTIWVACLVLLCQAATVAGQADATSTVTCAGTRSGTATTRVSEEVTCIITTRNNSASINASLADFGTPTTTPTVTVGALILDGTDTIKFLVTAPSTLTAFSINATLADATPLATADLNTVGTPTAASTLACVGDVSSSDNVRLSESVTCTLTVRGAAGTTTGVASDFRAPSAFVSGGTAVSGALATADGGATFTFSLTAPAAVTTSLNVRGALADGTVFTQGFVTLTVVGVPTVDSLLRCAGRDTGLATVRANEDIDCIIDVRDAAGSVVGFPADFAAPTATAGTASTITTLGSNPVSSIQMQFNISAPATVGSTLNLTGNIATGPAAFTQGLLTFSVVGTPSAASTVACTGAESGVAEVHVSELVNCVITVRDGAGTTTGLASDFGFPTIVGGRSVTAPVSRAGGAEMTFTVISPPATTDTFTIQGTLADGTALGAAIAPVIVGRPTEDSTLACVGDVTASATLARAGEAVTCTITIRDGSGATTGLVSDFANATLSGAVQTGALTLAAGRGTVTFKIQAPSIPETSFTMVGGLADGTDFLQGAVVMSTVGTPSDQSTVDCMGRNSGTVNVRVNEVVDCTITILASDGNLTTGFASDFAAPTVVGGVSVSALAAAAGNAQMVFTVAAPATITAFTVRGNLASGPTPFVQAGFALTVVGAPSAASTVACTGAESGVAEVHVSELVNCVITVRDGAGTTTGLASDFGFPTIVGGRSVTAPVSRAGGAEMTFTVISPPATTDTFTIQGTLADGTALGAAIAPVIVGRPTEDSTLACVGDVTASATLARAGEAVTCTITIRDGSGATTGLVSDFANATLSGAVQTGALTLAAGRGTVTFKIQAPAAVGASYSVVGNLADGTDFLQPAVVMSTVGTPSDQSTVDCVGQATGLAQVRVNEVVDCTITILASDGNLTTGFASDFAAPTVVGGVSVSTLTPALGRSQMVFTVAAPATITAFTVRGNLATGPTPFVQAGFALAVIGTPTADSTIACAGDVSGTTQVQVSEGITCNITVSDASGTTTGLARDFATLQTTVNGVALSAVQGLAPDGSTFRFTLRAPIAAATPFSVTGALADGTPFSQGAVTFVVLGKPNAKSTLACTSVRSGTSLVRVSETVTCVISARDDSGATTGVLGDFAAASVVGGVSATAISTTDFQSFAFNLTSPAAIGATFTVLGRLADGTPFEQGNVTLTVLGTPTADSVLTCIGDRSTTPFVRVSEAVTCTIAIRDAAGNPTTGAGADFDTPTVVGGVGLSALVDAADFSNVTFTLSSPAAVALFSVTGRIGGADFAAGPTNLTVVGTPSAQSTLVCQGNVSRTLQLVRAAELIECVLTFVDSGGAATTGVVADLAAPTVTSASAATPFVLASDRLTASFTVTSITTLLAVVSVTANLQGPQPIAEAPRNLTIVRFPDLTEFSLDLNNVDGNTIEQGAVLSFTFRSLVNATGQDVSKIALQGSAAASPSAIYALNDTVGFVAGDANALVRSITLSIADTNELKLDAGLAVSSATTFLAISAASGIRDAAVLADELVSFEGTAALPVTTFTADTSRPALTAGNGGFGVFDLAAGRLTFNFNEPVDAATLTVTDLLFATSVDATATLALSSGTTSSSPNGLQLVLQLSAADRNRFITQSVCGTRDTCWITLTSGFVSDMAGNAIFPESPSTTALAFERRPLLFVQDNVGPALLAFSLNLTAGTLALTFDEPIQAAQLTALTLQGLANATGATPARSHTLLDITTALAAAGETLTVTLGALDLNGILAADLGSAANDTFASLAAGLVTDTSNGNPNRVVPTTAALGVTGFTADATAPALTSFDLNLDSDELVLTFSEPMTAPAFQAGRIVLQAAAATGPSLTLTGGVLSGDRTTALTLKLSTADVSALKQNGNLATVRTNTFVSLAQGAFTDVAGNPTAAIAAGAALNAATVIPDATGPALVAFSLDLDQGELLLTFNDVAAAASFSAPAFTVQHAETRQAGLFVTLTGGTVPSPNGFQITVQLLTADLDAIKGTPGLANSTNSTFLTMDATAFDDISAVPLDVVAVTDGKAVQATAVVGDATAPKLLAFTLNVDTGVLALTFDEAMDPAGFDGTQFSLQDSSSSPTATVPLANSNVTRVSLTAYTVQLLGTTVDAIKAAPTLGTSTADTFGIHSVALGSDAAGNPLVAIVATAAQAAQAVTVDATAPTLLAFDLDLNAGTLSLTFDEVVNGSSLDAARITLQDATTATAVRALTGGNSSSATSAVVTLDLLAADLNAIKETPGLATEGADTFLRAGTGFVSDAISVDAVAIPDGSALQVTTYTPDTTAPALTSFDFDLGAGSLALTFSEAVNTTTFAASGFALQRAAAAGAVAPLALGGFKSTTASAFSTVVVAVLLDADLDAVKADPGVGASLVTTFLSLQASALADFAAQAVAPIAVSAAQQAANFADDATAPTLASFDLDMGVGVLRLTFSETVFPASFDATRLTIQSTAADAAPLTLTLAATSTSSTANGPVQNVTLSAAELNTLKAQALNGLASSRATAFLRAAAGVYADSAGNAAAATAADAALQATVFTPDTAGPTLVDFDVTMSAAQLPLQITLVFDETVDASSLNASQITLRNAAAASGASNTFVLTSGASASPDGTAITFDVSAADVAAIRSATPTLLLAAGSTLLTAGAGLVTDGAGVPSAAVAAGKAVRTYTADMVRPTITSFDLDLDALRLELTASESVDRGSFAVASIGLQAAGGSAATSFNLTAASSVSGSGFARNVTIVLGAADFDGLAGVVGLAASAATTFLTVASGATLDPAGNVLQPITAAAALPVTTFVADATAPTLLAFDLDMQAHTLALVFSEVMDVSTFSASAITLVSNRSSPAPESVTLTTSAATTVAARSSTVVVALSGADITSLELSSGLAASSATTFLALTAAAIQDAADNAVTALAPGATAAAVRTFTPDTTGPTLVALAVDFSTNLLTLSFDEVIRASTVRVADLTLLAPGGGSVALTTSTAGTANGLAVAVSLSVDDLAAVQTQSVCLSTATCAAAFPATFAQDMVANAVAAQAQFPVTTLLADARKPEVARFSEFDLDAGTLTLEFSEVVTLANFDPTALTLQGFFEDVLDNHTLTGGTLSSTAPNTTATLTLLRADINVIKASQTLCKSRGSCYLTATSAAVSDQAGNTLTPLVDGPPGTVVARFVPDSSGPVLSAFEFDMNTLQARLTFDEPVQSYDRGLTLQGKAGISAGDPSVQLEMGDVLNQSGTTLVVSITTSDAERIKAEPTLAVSSLTTFFTAVSTTVSDTALVPNPLAPILNGNGLQGSLIPDSTPPVLLEFSLDLNAGQLTLTFDEPMDAAGALVPGLTLQGLANTSNAALRQTLGAGSSAAAGPAPTVLVVALGEADTEALKTTAGLASQVNDTFLSIATGALSDTGNNSLAAIPPTAALQAAAVTVDATAARLVSFALDLNASVLDLVFDDVVDPATADVRQLTFQNGTAAVPPSIVALTLLSSVATSSPDFRIRIRLGILDAAILKETAGVAGALADTFLTMTANFIDDLQGTDAVAITTGLQAAAFTPDSVRPTLDSFNLNMNTGIVELSFSEPVSAPLALTQLRLHNLASSATESLSLTGGQVIFGTNRDAASVTLGATDDEQLRIKTQLAISQSSTFLSVSATFASDLVDLDIVPILDSAALQVSTFTADATQPTLASFSLDMSTGVLALTFSEAILASSLAATDITIQHAAAQVAAQAHRLTGGLVSTTDGNALTVTLSEDDLDAVKAISTLAVSRATTFLSAPSSLATDMVNNAVVAIAGTTAQNAVNFTADAVAPTLGGFEVDLDAALLRLNFSETMLASSLNLTALTLVDAQGGATTLTPAGSVSTTNARALVVTLAAASLNALKALALGTSTADTFLAVEGGAATDMAGNALVAIPVAAALRAAAVQADSAAPTLAAFALNMDTGRIALTFSEVINASGVVVGGLTLQATAASGGANHTPTGGSTVIVPASPGLVVEIALSTADLDALKLDPALATAQGSSFLSVAAGAFQDAAGNGIAAVGGAGAAALQAAAFVPDTTAPALVSFAASLDSGVLSLLFSEPVLASSVNPALVTVQSAAAGTKESLLLTSPSTASPDGTAITVILTAVDLNAIKAVAALAADLNTTFLSFGAFATDMAGTPIVAAGTESGVQAAAYTADSTAPALTAFALDLNANALVLTFSETVNTSSFDATALTLQDQAPSPSAELTLVDSTATGAPALTVSVALGPLDLAALQADTQLATSQASTFLRLTAAAVADMADNAVTPIAASAALNATAFTPDGGSPTLLAFDLDLDAGALTLTFSEVANASSLDVLKLTLQSDAAGTASRTLTGGTPSATDAAVLTVSLSATDLNAIKADTALAVSNATTFLSLAALAVADAAGNAAAALPVGLAVTLFTPDTSSPQLSAASLDLDAGTLALTFSETVDAGTLNATGAIALQATAAGGASVTLTGGATASPKGLVVSVTLEAADLDALKLDTGLAVSAATSFLSLTAAAIQDMNGNPVAPVAPGVALGVAVFVADATAPTLTGFDFDLDAGNLTLRFSEPVTGASLNATALVLQNQRGQTAEHRLTQSPAAAPANGVRLQFTVAADDLNAIKALASLATQSSDTFLRFDAGAVADLAGNPTAAVTDALAVAVTLFSADATRPQLVAFDLSLDSGVLGLTFSETVDGTTLTDAGLSINRNASSAAGGVALSGGTTTTVLSTVQSVTLSVADLNLVKADPALAVSPANAFLSVAATVIDDMAGLDVVAIPASAGLQATTVTADATDPALQAFSLDMDAGVLSFTFDESVLASSFDRTKVTLQDAGGSTATTLSGGTVTSANGITMDVRLAAADVAALKDDAGLATLLSNTFLITTAGAFTDMSARPLAAITVPLVATTFVPDTTPPALLNVSFSLDAGTLVLTFEEPVDAATLNPARLSFEDPSATAAPIALTNGTVVSNVLGVVTLDLVDADLFALQLAETVAVSQATTQVALAAAFIADKASSANSVAATVRQVVAFVQDATAPALSTFAVDLGLGQLVLNFDEPINATSFRAGEVTLTSQKAASPSALLQLTGGSVGAANGLQLTLALSSADLNAVKALAGLYDGLSTSFLSVTALAFADMAGNGLTAISVLNSLQAAQYTGDTTAPNLVRFDLDMDAGTIDFVFDETVNVSSLAFTRITLQAAASAASAQQFTLTGGALASGQADSTNVSLALAAADLDAIKAARIAVSQATAFVTLAADAVRDTSATQSIARVNGANALQAAGFTADTTPPALVSFNLDMDAGTLNLVFSETVDASSLRTANLTLQATASGGPTFALATSTAGLANAKTITVTLSVADLNALKGVGSLALQASASFLSFPASLVSDVSGNAITPRAAASALPVTGFTPDTTTPTVVAFDLDLNLAAPELTLEFSETVQAASVTIAALSLQANATSGAVAASLATTSTTTQVSATVVKVVLSAGDANAVKAAAGLAESAATTFLSAASIAAQDVVGNALAALAPSGAQAVRTYTADGIAPTLTAFDINIDTGVMALTFSESMAASLAASALTLQANATGGGAAQVLTGGVFAGTTDPTTFSLQLSTSDLNDLKLNPSLAAAQASSFLAVATALGTDTAGNAVSAIPAGAALQATAFTADTTSPVLSSFDLNMNTGVLTLSFSESVLLASFNAALIRVQNALTAAVSHQLTGGVPALSNKDADLALTLSTADLNAIKQAQGLATSASNVFLVLADTTVTDVAGNRVTPIVDGAAAVVSNFTADSVPPQLSSFTLDLDRGLIALTFNEALAQGSVNASFLTFNSEAAATPAASVGLTGGTIAYNADFSIATVTMTASDLDAIKVAALCNSTADCFLEITAQAATDVGGQPVVAIPAATGLQAAQLLVDSTSPQLTAFVEFNADAGTVTLRFTEAVDVATLSLTEFELHSSPDNSSSGFSRRVLTGGSSASANGDTIVVALAKADLDAIKLDENLCNAAITCWARFTPAFVADVFNNAVVAVVSPSSVFSESAQAFVADATAPRVTDFSLDLNSGLLAFTFDEPVKESTFSPERQGMVLQNLEASPTASVTLTSAAVAQSDGLVLQLQLSAADLTELKARGTLATGTADTFLTLKAGLRSFQDIEGNDNAAFPAAPAVQLGNFTADTTGPTLIAFSEYDANDGSITLQFDEPVGLVLDATQLTLAAAAPGGSNVTLTTVRTIAHAAPAALKTTVRVGISAADFTRVKVASNLGDDAASTRVLLGPALLQDVSGNPSAAVAARAQVATFIADTTPPTLLSFTLDMDTGVLGLSFDDVVDASTLDAVHITLQHDSARSSTALSYVLTGGATASADGFAIDLPLLALDLNSVKLIAGLATAQANTFLTLTSEAISDIQGTPVRTIVSNNGLQATTFTADGTAPQLANFTLDVDAGVVALTFSEALAAATFDATQLTLADAAALPTASVTLSADGAPVVSQVGTVVTFSLPAAKLDEIKAAPSLGNATSNTFLSAAAATADDTSGNALAPAVALQAAAVTPDTTRPSLVSFDIDLDAGSLALTFSETMDPATFVASELTVQDAAPASAAANQIALSGGVLTGGLSTVLTLALSATDLNAIKGNTAVATSLSNSHLQITDSAIRDTAGNRVEAIADASALRATAFTADATSPELAAFAFDLDAGTVNLTFSETVAGTTFASQHLTFQATAGGGEQHTLSAASVLAPTANAPVLTLRLSAADLNSIKALDTLATSQGSTFLSATPALVRDMSNQLNVAILASAALGAAAFVADSTAPQASSLAVDLDAGTLALVFDEPIRASTLDTTQLTVLAAPSAAASLRLTLATTVTASANGLAIVIPFSVADLNTVKANPGLLVSLATSFVAFTDQFVADMAGNAVTAVAQAGALQTAAFVNDQSKSAPTSFDLNMNTGLLALTFPETMDVSTVDFTRITLQSSANARANDLFALAGGALASAADSTVVQLTVAVADLNVLKLRGIGRSSGTAFLTVADSAVLDTSGTGSRALLNGVSALQVTTLVTDSVSPSLARFALDMDAGTVVLTFDESVDKSTLDVTGLLVQDAVASTLNFTLTTGSKVCSTCNGDQFETAACTRETDTACAPCSSCAASEFVQTGCSASGDTVCGTCAVCNPSTQFVKRACGGRDDTVCAPCTACVLATQFEAAACSAASDTVCTDCVACASTEFLVSACTASANTVCQTCAACASGQFTTARCSATADTQCSACAALCAAGEFEAVACTATSDRACATCSVCGASEFQTAACSVANDTACQTCSACGDSEFEASACSAAADTVCQSCAVCGSGQFVQTHCSAAADTVCTSCSANCAACTGPGATCITCGAGTLLHNGTCVAACPAGTFGVGPGPSGRTCEACHPTCAECSGPTASECTVCDAPLTLSSGACTTSCTGNQFDDGTGSCVTCDPNCATCQVAATTCTSCASGQVLLAGSTCASACPGGFFPSAASICEPCTPNCNNCTAAGAACSQCAGGAYLDSGRCVFACPPDFHGVGL